MGYAMAAFKLVFLLFTGVFAWNIEERYEKIDPEIIKLAELHPGEVVIRKRDYLVNIGMVKASEWDDSSLLNDFSDYIRYITTFAILRNDRSVLRETRQPRIRKPIQDPVLFAILLAAMRHHIEDAERIVKQHGRRDHIYAFSNQIKSHIYERSPQGFKFLRDMDLFALCSLTQTEKDSLLMILPENMPYMYKIRALAGDTAAEKGLINLFNASDEYYFKAQMGIYLANLGTENALKTLVTGLACSLFTVGYSSKTSIRVPILLALGRAFPQEQLFGTLPYVLSQGHERGAGYSHEDLLQYMKDLKNWAGETLTIELDLKSENFYLNPYWGDIYPDYRDRLTPRE